MSRIRNRKGENSRRRKRTLIKKAHEYGELSGADIAFFIYKSGHWFTYRSTNRQSFPPSWDEIVSFQMSYPLPVNLLPQDFNVKSKLVLPCAK
ncbi:uncharacterized protein K444DRAFT_538700 [Hyaloscypha bicolor E]|uniref:Uncharacterized protein n=1 Tax=Hyaloscypha bicolor E TaxID=1095630 RepID=A0A2J6SWY6_9HELO|nr:uncharacterized protein K444DRAFT_538700 [Hyaloscypha bicolor E]PMD55289.1 hypothetical protein K444DRAFT_538700 [Hyaloscypha bicolor E]